MAITPQMASVVRRAASVVQLVTAAPVPMVERVELVERVTPSPNGPAVMAALVLTQVAPLLEEPMAAMAVLAEPARATVTTAAMAALVVLVEPMASQVLPVQ